MDKRGIFALLILGILITGIIPDVGAAEQVYLPGSSTPRGYDLCKLGTCTCDNEICIVAEQPGGPGLFFVTGVDRPEPPKTIFAVLTALGIGEAAKLAWILASGTPEEKAKALAEVKKKANANFDLSKLKELNKKDLSAMTPEEVNAYLKDLGLSAAQIGSVQDMMKGHMLTSFSNSDLAGLTPAQRIAMAGAMFDAGEGSTSGSLSAGESSKTNLLKTITNLAKRGIQIPIELLQSAAGIFGAAQIRQNWGRLHRRFMQQGYNARRVHPGMEEYASQKQQRLILNQINVRII